MIILKMGAIEDGAATGSAIEVLNFIVRLWDSSKELLVENL